MSRKPGTEMSIELNKMIAKGRCTDSAALGSMLSVIADELGGIRDALELIALGKQEQGIG